MGRLAKRQADSTQARNEAIREALKKHTMREVWGRGGAFARSYPSDRPRALNCRFKKAVGEWSLGRGEEYQ